MSHDNYAIRFMFLAYQLSVLICDTQYRTCLVLFFFKIACILNTYLTAALISSSFENILLVLFIEQTNRMTQLLGVKVMSKNHALLTI